MTVRIGPAKTATQCPLCREALADLPLGRCHSCATTFHQECLEEMGGCPTNGCAQRGLVPLDVERPSACPACGEFVPGDSYDCVCGGRYHLECVLEGCIRPACRFFEVPLGGRKRPIDWRPWIQRASLGITLAAASYVLYLLLAQDPRAQPSVLRLAATGMVLIVASFVAAQTGRR